VDVRTVEM